MYAYEKRALNLEHSVTGQQRPFPSRRELREASRPSRNRRTFRPAFSASAVVRAAILTGLLATTVAVPVTGFVGPESSMSLPGKTSAVTTVESSWADARATEATVAESLREVATAASRARIRTPLEVSQCDKNAESANGDRPVNLKPAIVWPMVEGTFKYASPFGNRFHPILGYSRLHAGIDLAGPVGTPIYAAADGVVVDSRPQAGHGYWVRIQHEYPNGGIYFTGYAHMFAHHVLVKEGDHVSVGQQIASVGNTGMSTGPHLHFEVHDASDTPIDPWPWLHSNNAMQPGGACQ